MARHNAHQCRLRTVHIVDVENLAGGEIDTANIRASLAKYGELTDVDLADLVIVGIAAKHYKILRRISSKPAGVRPGARGFSFNFTEVLGHDDDDGADEALITALALIRSPSLVESYRQVSFASGDGKFISSADECRSDGLSVLNVIGMGDQARRWKALLTNEISIRSQLEAFQVERTNAPARRKALVAEAEDIGADTTDWKTGSSRLSAIVREWRTIPPSLRARVDEALWARLSVARNAFDQRRDSYFEGRCVRAEALSDSTEWDLATRVFEGLMTEWKAAGRPSTTNTDALWTRFKTAHDTFFNTRDTFRANSNADLTAVTADDATQSVPWGSWSGSGTVPVYQLAKELGVSNGQVLQLLSEQGIIAESPDYRVGATIVHRVRQSVGTAIAQRIPPTDTRGD